MQRYFFDLLSNDELETLAAVFDRLLQNLTRDDAQSAAVARPTP